MIKVRYISDTSIMMDERTIRWRPNESTEGAAAGSGASGRGSPEFLGDFTKTVAGLRLTHYYNRPYNERRRCPICLDPAHRLG
jgi:hypothetical protein